MRVAHRHKWQGYVLCVVSDQGEHEIFLRSQLYSIFRLLQMFFGPLALQKKQSPFFLKVSRAASPVALRR